jgi:hypothetical protein
MNSNDKGTKYLLGVCLDWKKKLKERKWKKIMFYPTQKWNNVEGLKWVESEMII